MEYVESRNFFLYRRKGCGANAENTVRDENISCEVMFFSGKELDTAEIFYELLNEVSSVEKN